MRKIKSAGQSISELALCITVVVMALVGMRLYLQRNLQANYREGVRQFFTKLDEEKTRRTPAHRKYQNQYETYYYTDSDMIENSGNFIPGRGKENIIMRSTTGAGIIDTETQRSGRRVTYE